MAKSVRNVNVYPADTTPKGSVIITFYAEQGGDEFEVWVGVNAMGVYTDVQWWFNDGKMDTQFNPETITNIMNFLAGRWSPDQNQQTI